MIDSIVSNYLWPVQSDGINVTPKDNRQVGKCGGRREDRDSL